MPRLPSPCAFGDSEQLELQSRLQVEDSPEVLSWRRGKDLLAGLHYVAGVDISFVKESPNLACAMLAVLSFPELEVSCEVVCECLELEKLINTLICC